MCIKLKFENLKELKDFARAILATEESGALPQVQPVQSAQLVQSVSQPQPVQPTQPQPEQPVQPVPTATAYTPQQLASAAMQLKDAGRLMELPPLLSQFGVSAVTQLKPEQYTEFANALVRLGVKL